MAKFTYEVKRNIGTIEKGMELRVVSWCGKSEKYDIRKWYSSFDGEERCGKGITFSAAEAAGILGILNTKELAGEIPSQGTSKIKVQLTKYGYEIALYNNDYRLKGATLSSDGIVALRELLNGEFGDKPLNEITEKSDEKPVNEEKQVDAPTKIVTLARVNNNKGNRVVKALTDIPVNDSNYPIRTATKEELIEAIRIMEAKPDGNKTRLTRCKARLAHLEKCKDNTKVVAEPTTKDVVEPTKIQSEISNKANVIIFPKKDTTKIKRLQPSNIHYKYEDAKAKLDKEREMFKGDRDSEYVIDGILEACVSDQELLDNVMREDKSYFGAFQYFANKARQGYCMKVGNVSVMDANTALKYAIDYFNSEEEKAKVAMNDLTKNKKNAAKKSAK